MSKKLWLTILLIILITTLGCINKEEFFSETGKFSKIDKGTYNDLEISIELQKTTFKIGESINVLFVLKNKGTNLIQLNDKGFDAGIYRPDGTFVTYIRRENDITKSINLGSDISFVESIDWPDNNLEPGEYYLIGYLKAETIYKDSNDKIDPYTIKTRPLTIDIE